MRARLPPPAPISTRSTEGTESGKPEPFLKRYIRATSRVFVTSGSPPTIRQDLAVVPPMSKHSRRSSPRRRANQLPARAPAAGPLSTSRSGAPGASPAGARGGGSPLPGPSRSPRGTAGGQDAPVRHHHKERATEPLGREPLLQF